jgi:RNA-binding protein YhbY
MTKKTLKDYLLGIKKEHEFTVRIALPELTEEQMTRIENNLKAHELIKITKPKKTIWQKHPLGFAEPVCSEITIFEVTTGLPAECFYLGREIAKILKISEIHVVVNGTGNPLQVLNLEKDPDYVVRAANPDYPEAPKINHDDYVGQGYIDGMLKTIMDAKKKDPNSIIQTPTKSEPKKKK